MNFTNEKLILMRKYLCIVSTLLIITSCQIKEPYPFRNIEISTIINDRESELEIKDSSAIREFTSFLKGLNRQDLIVGKKFHKPKKLCRIIIKNEIDDDISFLIRSSKKDGITADFASKNKAENNTHYYGRLYKTKKLVNLLEKHSLGCKKIKSTKN